MRNMHVLVDTNILVDYAFKKDYAVNFFQECFRSRYEVFVLEDVYSEAKKILSDSNFNILRDLFKQFEFAGLYRKIKTNKKLNAKVDALTAKCKILLGYDLDRTDRKMIIVSQRHDLYLLTKDKDLRQVAKSEGCRVLAL